MASSADGDQPDTLEELVEETRGPREAIVNGLRFHGGETHSKKLRRFEKVPSKNYHFNKLEEQGLVEQQGEASVGKGGSAKIYRLTSTGHEVAEALSKSSGVTETITDLIEQIEQQREEIDELQEAHNEMANFVEELEEQIAD